MKEQLIELIGSKICGDYHPACDIRIPHSCGNCYANDCKIEELVDSLIASGVVLPPCKVGDTVWWVTEVCDENCEEKLDILVGKVVSFSIQPEGLWAYCHYECGLTYWHVVAEDFGETLFLSKEAAEQALKERGG